MLLEIVDRELKWSTINPLGYFTVQKGVPAIQARQQIRTESVIVCMRLYNSKLVRALSGARSTLFQRDPFAMSNAIGSSQLTGEGTALSSR